MTDTSPSFDPFAVGAAALGALVRVIGDPWTPTIAFVQPNGSPLDLTGAQSVGADFYIEGLRGPLATLTGIVATPAYGEMAIVIAGTLTAQAPERDPDFSTSFPTRLVGWYVDSLGQRHSDALILYCPVSAARARVLPPQDDGVTVVVHEQGPAGPTQTVNGHAGAVITLTAADVGAATLAQVFAALAALPTTLPSQAGQPWNNGGSISVS